jgi:hypothetical protein
VVRKRHHYVPKAYLQFFCDADGKVHIHLKDDLARQIHQSPDNFAFHKYYYSQPLPGGGRDHDALENFFSQLEAEWPPLVKRLQRREAVDDDLDTVFQFVGLQRARVPAARDASERMAAAQLKADLLTLDAMGKLPPKPVEHPDILDSVEFSIDPHHSIHSMPARLRAMGDVLDRVGLGVLHNKTSTPFLTSDNPVVYFDPRMGEEELRPYTLDRVGGTAVLCFPITPDLMLYGHSCKRDAFKRSGLRHGDLVKREMVDMMNRMTARFAYRAVFASAPGFESLVRCFAQKSPIVESTIVQKDGGTLVRHDSVFGPRQPKPKWEA